MRKSLLSAAVLGALYMPAISMAEEAPAKEPESSWSVTTNIGFVSDYYVRGVSQTWHKPALQGGIDLTHSNGFYAGVWGSNVSPNTFPDASTEIDVYAGYNGSISAVEGLGYTVGAIGYIYPGGDWKKCTLCAPYNKGGRWDTYEANFGLSYKWLSAKASVTLGDWFGAEKGTGFESGSSGTTYVELNAAYPLPWYGLTLIGHVGHLNVSTKLIDGLQAGGGRSPDYTDYKVGLSKAFSIAKSEGWNAGLYYVGANDNGYWGKTGFGGPSFNGNNGLKDQKDLTDNRWVISLGRAF